ncbi:hypothetical protein BDW75DRAFT_196569 [Aspergillus navahoensis]
MHPSPQPMSWTLAPTHNSLISTRNILLAALLMHPALAVPRFFEVFCPTRRFHLAATRANPAKPYKRRISPNLMAPLLIERLRTIKRMDKSKTRKK